MCAERGRNDGPYARLFRLGHAAAPLVFCTSAILGLFAMAAVQRITRRRVRKGLASSEELTYMSIDDVIVDRVNRGMLFPLWPKRQGDTPRRALLLSEEMYVALTAERQNPADKVRFGELRADLEQFVVSETLDGKYLFHLYPSRDCVWEIRSVRSEPSIRVLGFLASRDIFVATTYALREALGGWQSREWKQIKRRAGAQWRSMFDPYPPLAGTDPTKHVSGVLSGKFFETRG